MQFQSKSIRKLLVVVFTTLSIFLKAQSTGLILPQSVNVSSSFIISPQVTFASSCSNYYSEIWIPADFYSVNIQIGNGAAIGATLNSDRRQDQQGGVNYTVIRVDYTNPNGQGSVYQLLNTISPNQICEESKSYVFYTKLFCNDGSTPVSLSEANVSLLVTRPQRQITISATPLSDYCNVNSPMRIKVFPSYNFNGGSFQNTQITFDKNNQQIKCIGVIVGNRNFSTDYFAASSTQNIAFTDNTNTVTFEAADINYKDYLMYFEVIGTQPIPGSATYPISISSGVTVSGCSSSETLTGTTSVTVINNDCIDDAYVNAPDIKSIEFGNACLNSNCDNTNQPSFSVWLDNNFKGEGKSSYTNEFKYVLDVAPEINLTTFRLREPLASLANGQTLTIDQTVTIEYQVYGNTTDWYTLSVSNPNAVNAISLAGGQRISKMVFSFNHFPDNHDQYVDCNYTLSYPTEPGYTAPAQPASSYPYTTSIVYNEQVIKSRPPYALTPQSDPVVCSPNVVRDFFSNQTTSNFQSYYYITEKKFTQPEETGKVLLQLTTKQLLEDYSFLYQLNANGMDYVGDIKFYYGPNYNNVIGQYDNSFPLNTSDFLTLSDFKAQYFSSNKFLTMDAIFDPQTNNITISGLDLDQDCQSVNKFYVLFNIKLDKYAQSIPYRNNPTKTVKVNLPDSYYSTLNFYSGYDCGNYVYYHTNYKPEGIISFKRNLYINTAFNTTFKTEEYLKSEDEFNYHFVLENDGNTALKDAVLVSSFPYVNDTKVLYNNFNRESTFLLNAASIESISLYLTDVNNIVTTIPSSQYTIQYAPLTNVCINELYYNSCNPSNWSNDPASVSNQPFAIKLKTQNFNLPPYSKLDFSVTTKLPAITDVDNQKAVISYAAAARLADASAAPILPEEDNLATIYLYPPPCSECVPSFSPIPGQEYLLSAWVKEEFGNQYPDTYVNSGIRITFNFNSAPAIFHDFGIFKPTGPIIDGWQRIESSFIVPMDARNIQIILENNSPNTINAFFDDIRIHPFRSNMKSFVYNPYNQKVEVILDENNYATLYEYDDEGILVRVKKETERGVMTIKETRNNQSKR